jgi:hypothetical protein
MDLPPLSKENIRLILCNNRMDALSFYIPGQGNEYAQEASYAFFKELAEDFTGEEIYANRISRLINRLDGVLVVVQVGEMCPVYKTRILAIFENSCTYVVVSEGHIYNPLAIRKDEVKEVTYFREEEVYLKAS